jgi:ABC-type multidrug transport system permease subunit
MPASKVCSWEIKEEIAMYVTDVIWWSYTLFIVASALFMVWFTLKVRQKGD